MIDDYQLRKDIDIIIRFIEGLEDNTSLKELLGKFYDQSEVDVVTAKLNSDLAKLNTDLTDLDAQLSNAETSLDELEATLSRTRESLTTALSTLEDLDTELDSAKSRITSAESSITSAEGSITAHQTAISNLNTELDSAKSRITSAENSITSANQSISQHTSTLSSLDTELDGALTRLTSAETSLSSLRTSLTSLDGSLTLLSDLLVNFEGDLQDFDAELVDRGINKSSLNTDIYDLVSQICLVKQNVSDTDTKIDDAVTDINNLDQSVVPNLKSKVAEAKSSGDTAQSQLQQTKTDLENLNDTVFPNLIGAIDTAEQAGTTAQTQLQQTKTELNNLNTSTFTGLKSKIDDAKQAGLDAQGDLQDAVDDIENMTGVVFPTLKTTIQAVQGDITDVQGDIGTFDRTVHGSLYTQITNLDSISDFIVATNYNWQNLWIGARDNVSWKTLIESTGILRYNLNYAYDGNFYVSDGVTWSRYNNSVILDNVEFACAVVDGFNATKGSLARDIELDRIFDISTNTWYQYSSNSWSSVSSPDVYMEICLSKIVNSNIGGGISGLNPQSEINNNLLSEIGNKQDSIPNMTLRQTITQGNVVIRIYSDDLYVYVVASGSVSQNGNINLTDTIDSAYCPFSDSVYELDGTGNAHKIILFESGAIRLVTGSGTDTLNLKMTCMYPLVNRLPSGVSQ